MRGIKDEFSKRPLFLFALIAVIFSLIYANFPKPEISFPFSEKEHITLTGKVINITPDETGNIKSLEVKYKGGKCICYVNNIRLSESAVVIGSEVIISGEFHTFSTAMNPGEFDAHNYYENRGYHFYVNLLSVKTTRVPRVPVKDRFYRLRRFFTKRVLEQCPLEGDLINTLLFGDRSGLDAERKELFKYANLSHFTVLSGLHFSLAGGGIYILLRRTGLMRRYAAVFSIAFVLFYGCLAGFAVSVIRASIMFAVRLFADIINRTYDLMSALSLAAIVTLFINPSYIKDPSFIYSYTAVFSLALYYTYLFREHIKDIYRNVYGRNTLAEKLGKIKEYMAAPLVLYCSMSVFTLYFQSYTSLLSIPVNLVLALMSGPVMVFSALAFLFSLLHLGLPAKVFDFFVAIAMRILDKLSVIVSKADAFKIIYKPAIWQAILYIAVLITLAFILKRRTGKLINVIILLSTAVISFSPVYTGFSATSLYVGQGDCMVIRLNKRHALVVDAGSSTKADIGKNVLVPYLMSQGITKIDDVYLSHEDDDHVNGIDYLCTGTENVRVKRIIIPNAPFKDLQDIKGYDDINAATIQKGASVNYGSVSIYCLWPDSGYLIGDANSDSMVLWLRYKDFDMLLSGDATKETEAKISYPGITADVYKCAHHGSSSSSVMNMLKTVRPAITIVSCGKNNRYGHPHPETLKRLQNVNSKVFRTDESGAVTVIPFKRGIKVYTYTSR